MRTGRNQDLAGVAVCLCHFAPNQLPPLGHREWPKELVHEVCQSASTSYQIIWAFWVRWLCCRHYSWCGYTYDRSEGTAVKSAYGSMR